MSSTQKKRVDHFFKDVNELVDQAVAKCDWHGPRCEGVCRKGERLDSLTLGPPCQAFTRRRSHKGTTAKTGSVSGHPLFSYSVDFILLMMEQWNPRGLIMEQVPAFKNDADVGDGVSSSWCDYLQRELASCGYSSEVFVLSLTQWIDISRDRLLLECVSLCSASPVPLTSRVHNVNTELHFVAWETHRPHTCSTIA